MMIQEFEELTGLQPTMMEYAVIEEMYYDFNGDKREFCKKFTAVENGLLNVARMVASEMKSDLDKAQKEAAKEKADLEAKIKRLEAQLEREQEWKPWTNKNAVKQEDYDHLRRCGHEMTDDEAKDWIASEWGFDRSKIRICRKMKTFERNRHSQLRQVGEVDRDPYYDATDWYYVFFRVCGMEYEAYNGSLTQL